MLVHSSLAQALCSYKRRGKEVKELWPMIESDLELIEFDSKTKFYLKEVVFSS